MRIGSVVAPGPVVKLAITRSSSDRVKASSQPEMTAGQNDRQRDDEERLHRRRAEVEGGFLQALVEGDEPRLHDDGHVAHGERGVRQHDGPEAAVEVDGHEQQQQREAENDLRHHQRRKHHAVEQRRAAIVADSASA